MRDETRQRSRADLTAACFLYSYEPTVFRLIARVLFSSHLEDERPTRSILNAKTGLRAKRSQRMSWPWVHDLPGAFWFFLDIFGVSRSMEA
jgi:hypothetical protein